MRAVFFLAVMLLAVCAAKIAIAAPTDSRQVSGTWVLNKYSNGPSVACSTDSEDWPDGCPLSIRYTEEKRLNLSFDFIWDCEPVTIKVSSGQKQFSLNTKLRGRGDDSEGCIADGEIEDEAAFYDFFRSTDHFDIEINDKEKVHFDMPGTAQAVDQLKQAFQAYITGQDDSALAPPEKIAGKWHFHDGRKNASSCCEPVSSLIYETPFDPARGELASTAHGGFVVVECMHGTDTIDFVTNFLGKTREDSGDSIIRMMSGDKKLEFNGFFDNGSDGIGGEVRGEIGREKRSLFYDLFNAADTLVVEAEGHKMLFDLHGSQKAVRQMRQACPVPPPCCTKGYTWRTSSEDNLDYKEISYQPAEDAEVGEHPRPNFVPLSIRCNAPYGGITQNQDYNHLDLTVRSRGVRWQAQPVTINISSGQKRLSIKSRMGADGYSDDSAPVWGIATEEITKDRAAFYDLLRSADWLVIEIDEEKTRIDLRGAKAGIDQLERVCPAQHE